jgi:hypothetical protein
MNKKLAIAIVALFLVTLSGLVAANAIKEKSVGGVKSSFFHSK